MRVALLSYNARVGDAIGNNVAEKLRFFRDRGADARVFVESDQGLHPDVRGRCHVIHAVQPSSDHLAFLRSADLICVEFGQYYPALSLLPMLADGKRRIVLDYHGITPPALWGGHNRENLVQGLQHRGLAWIADATLTHSTYTQDELATVTQLPRERLPRLGFPIDREFFAEGPSAEECRRSLNLEGKRVVLFVGRLAPNKRAVMLVEALQHLTDMIPSVHVVIVGDTSDLYEAEAQRCIDRAQQLGIQEQVHLVGVKLGEQLRDYYRAANVLVVPSLWESFCIPVVEAMASGLPVVAARTTAIPETVGSAGLTFKPDDAADLARQLRRVLSRVSSRDRSIDHPTIAVVASRFGSDFASGAEASLRQMAIALRDAGCGVEVFATCTNSETGRTSEFPPGTAFDDGIPVHRFALAADTADSTRQPGIDSPALLVELSKRIANFDYLVTGPYLASLTAEVAERWPEKTIVVPCFHDEPEARLERWPELYDRVAGIFYHSSSEQHFAERALGINHPGSAVIGTYIDTATPGDAARGRRLIGADNYVVYSGRYSQGKNLPLLLDFARRFDDEHPGELRFVFTGQGETSIPRQPWAIDLGFLSEDKLRDVLSGAVALVQLSLNESLSLAALQAWAQGVPVVAHRNCAVLAEHIQQSGGGLLVENYEQFAAALAKLLDSRQTEQGDTSEFHHRLGLAGQRYVCAQFGSPEAFQRRLLGALADVRKPLPQRMRERGLQRAAKFDREIWRQQFCAIIENVLHAEPREFREDLVVQPRGQRCTARNGTRAVLIPARVSNRGSVPAVAVGPCRTVLCGDVVDAQGSEVRKPDMPTSLPALLLPGQTISVSVMIPVPAESGTYEIRLWAQCCDRPLHERPHETSLPLIHLSGGRQPLESDLLMNDGQGVSQILDEVQAALVESRQIKDLPNDYQDITQGAFARLKKRIKQKLLGNFKKAYVDVLSRQQSACNQQLLAAVQALSECCATLDHTVRELQERLARYEASAPKEEHFTAQQADRRHPELRGIPDLAISDLP